MQATSSIIIIEGGGGDAVEIDGCWLSKADWVMVRRCSVNITQNSKGLYSKTINST